MGGWIKYDGTNKPSDDTLVRVRFPDGWVSGDQEWEAAGLWSWHEGGEADDDLISHFQVKAQEAA